MRAAVAQSSARLPLERVRSRRGRPSKSVALSPTGRDTNQVKEMASSRRQTVQRATDDVRRFRARPPGTQRTGGREPSG